MNNGKILQKWKFNSYRQTRRHRNDFLREYFEYLLTYSYVPSVPSCSDKLSPCESERTQPLVSSFYFGVAETV